MKISILSILSFFLFAFAFSCGNEAGQQQATSGVTASSTPGIDELTQKIMAAPNDASLYAQRGALLYENENVDEGIADLNKALELDSTQAEYYHTLADMYMDYYKSGAGLTVMQRAGAVFPRRIPTLLKLAEFQWILKQHTEALFTLERIRTIDPQNAEMFFMFGNVFKDMGKNDQAINAYQSAVENDPGLVDSWINLAQLLADKGSPVAGKYFDNALRVDSNNIEALHAKAYYLSNTKNDLQGAIALYKKINTLAPQYEEGYYNAGLLYLDMDSLDQAYRSFDLTVNIAPAFAAAYYHRGLAAEMLGKLKQAKSDYENVLRLDPEFQSAKTGLQRLK
ncbi:MAG: tetratricopeptide repeat protein [Saprospiraceae bacterium]|nr:MAG: tetratricopeptide repeat protein [Saprospiraceae bacterium]